MSTKSKSRGGNSNMTVAIVCATITVILLVGMFAYFNNWYPFTPGPPDPPSDDPNDIQYTLRVIVTDEDVVPHSTNYFWVGISLTSAITVGADNSTLGPYIEDFQIWQDDVVGRQFDGTSIMQYSFNLLEAMLEDGNEMRISITDPENPFDLVVWNLGGVAWQTGPTFTDGNLLDVETTGEFWYMETVVCTGEYYDVYFELIP